MMDRYAHVAQYVYGSVWALLPAKMAAILDLLSFRAAGGRLTDEEIQQRIGAAQRPTPTAPGAIAVLPVYGTLANHAGMMAESSGGVSTRTPV
jgi:capsid assembly protease